MGNKDLILPQATPATPGGAGARRDRWAPSLRNGHVRMMVLEV